MTKPDSQIVAAVSARDYRWFQDHPERLSYFRSLVPGEFPPDLLEEEECRYVLVTKIEGGRMRRAMTLPEGMSIDAGTGQLQLHQDGRTTLLPWIEGDDNGFGLLPIEEGVTHE